MICIEPRQPFWTDEQDALLSALWAKDATCEAIGRELGKSKSAIAARRRRLALPERGNPVGRTGQGAARINEFAELLSRGFEISEIRARMSLNNNQAQSTMTRIRNELGAQAI